MQNYQNYMNICMVILLLIWEHYTMLMWIVKYYIIVY